MGERAGGDGARSDWLVLAVVLVGAFMAILDVAIINVAIPSIRKDLHTSFGAVELVITGYTITYACLLVTGGRLGDIFGCRRLFIAGILVFTAASALCGAAPSVAVLVAARAVQGIGGAMLYPQVLSIIQVTFGGEQRARLLRLMAFALVSYPRLLPQVTRMVTGHAPDDADFVDEWEDFLRAVGSRFEPRKA